MTGQPITGLPEVFGAAGEDVADGMAAGIDRPRRKPLNDTPQWTIRHLAQSSAGEGRMIHLMRYTEY